MGAIKSVLKTTVLVSLAAFSGGLVPQGALAMPRVLKSGKRSFSPRSASPRVAHAREILGSELYAQSALPVAERWASTQVSSSVIRVLKQRLPEKDRPRARRIAQALLTESARYGFDPFFVLAMMATESRFNPRTVGSVGEIGLLQVRPTTAAWIAKRNRTFFGGAHTLFNPAENIRLGLAYVAYLRDSFQSQSRVSRSAYNMGGLAVRRLVSRSIYPAEYPGRIVENYLKIYKDLAFPRAARVVFAAN